MSSLRTANHRPRSHSTSSSSPSPSPIRDHAWRAATKRSHPHHPFSPGASDCSSPHKWDVDMWRRGKRARRDTTLSSDNVDVHAFGRTSSSAVDGHHSTVASSPYSARSTPAFASTSAEFQLFPKRTRKSRRSSSRFNPLSTSPEIDRLDIDDLARLRSDAFWQLRRSVEDSGEGLVSRMRDYENSRSRAEIYSRSTGLQKRGRERPSSDIYASRPNAGDGLSEEEEDEVQIFSGEVSSGQLPWISRKKRALSLGVMDVDAFRSSPSNESQRGSSPGPTCHSNPSTFPSDDDDDENDDLPTGDVIHQFAFDTLTLPSFAPPANPSGVDLTPALSNTRTSSTNSSLISLPLPPPLPLASPPWDAMTSSSLPSSIPAFHNRTLPSTASRSEKAIAALSLAMANGAGGLNDYEALRGLQEPVLLDSCQVGELWH